MQSLHATSRSVVSGAVAHKRIAVGCVPRPAVTAHNAAHSLARGGAPSVVSRRSVVVRGKVEKISGEQLEVAIASRETTLIVDFFATWCGPCLLLAKELEQVAEQMEGKVKVVKIDVDENPDLSTMLKIQGLPTIVFIPKENGKPALRTEGWLPAAQIMEIVGQLDAGVPVQPVQPEQEAAQQ